MKPEKMTDEELSKLLGNMERLGMADTTRVLRAHITALTAERDEQVRLREQAYLSGWRLVEEADAIGDERDALRERVQALEGDLAAERHSHGVTTTQARLEQTTRIQLQRHLAAIRQRAGDAERLAKVAESCAIMGSLGSAGWDDDIHADVVARGAETMLRDAARGIARYVLGEDATGAKATHPLEDTQGCGLCPGCTDENWADGDLCETPRSATNPEPTTAEAFAILRTCVAEKRNVDALSLLERRMGAIDAAAREAANELATVFRPDNLALMRRCHDIATRIESAITDAPPVFTLEEVRAAMDDWCNREQMDEVSKRLATLRKV